MFINWALQEIHLKIVYYGPGLSGKTANLEYIHSQLDSGLKSDLVTLKSREDGTVFYDYLQLEVGKIDGKKSKFNLYTVPGKAHYHNTRKNILNGVDGLVYVADSQTEMMDANLDTLLDLEKHLASAGLSLKNFPWIIQYNKRDLPRIETLDEMEKKLNLFQVPSFETTANMGDGVMPALKAVIKLVVAQVQKDLAAEKRMRA